MGREDSVSGKLYGCCVAMVLLQAERLTVLTRLEEMTSRHKQLSTELDKYKDCDPERLKEVRECDVLLFPKTMSLISRHFRQGDHGCHRCSQSVDR